MEFNWSFYSFKIRCKLWLRLIFSEKIFYVEKQIKTYFSFIFIFVCKKALKIIFIQLTYDWFTFFGIRLDTFIRLSFYLTNLYRTYILLITRLSTFIRWFILGYKVVFEKFVVSNTTEALYHRELAARFDPVANKS